MGVTAASDCTKSWQEDAFGGDVLQHNEALQALMLGAQHVPANQQKFLSSASKHVQCSKRREARLSSEQASTQKSLFRAAECTT